MNKESIPTEILKNKAQNTPVYVLNTGVFWALYCQSACAAAYLTAMHSTSTSAPLGSVFTATAERAGNGCVKNSA